MPTVALLRVSAFVLIASCLLFAQRQFPTPASPSQTNALAEQQPTNPGAPPATNVPAQPATQPPSSESGHQTAATPKPPLTPKEEAWQMLATACAGDKTSDRAMAIRVLGLMPNNTKARTLAERALSDDKPEVRSAAAAALGDMKSRISISKLRAALDDKDP